MALLGSIRVPSDKSISHRAVLFAGLASGTSRLQSVLPSADVRATMGAMAALGARIELAPGANGLSGSIEGIGLAPRSSGPFMIDCGNSGTTARLLLGVLAGLGVDAMLVGDASLTARPMERVMNPLRKLGASFECADGHLPVRVVPNGRLSCARVRTEQASAQVKSAILLAGMQADGVTSVTEPSASRNHTELLLPAFGVDVEVAGRTSSVTGPASMHAHDMAVPGDPSSAAFVAVAAALVEGSDVLMEQVALNPTRTGAFAVLERMGCELSFENEHAEGAEPVGDIRVRFAPELAATRVAADEIPTLIDEIPILAIAAALAAGETVFESAGELRVKESDRMAAIIDGLSTLGVKAFADGDDLHVVGNPEARFAAPRRVFLPTHGDHRLAMTWHLAGLAFGIAVELDDSACVCVSWPDFFDDIEGLVS